jgi:pimeloyl-ACP methyl ester carboxylesterase
VLKRLHAKLREAKAVARQAWLLPRDTAEDVVPDAASGDDVVLFLHGLFASAGVLQPMRLGFMRHAGVRTGAFSYAPGPGVVELNDRLSALTAKLPGDVNLHLVGHSLGGIVARYYSQHASDDRLRSLTTLASPFAGVPLASKLALFEGARDLAPESPLLAQLRERPVSVPHLALLGEEDQLTSDRDAHTASGSTSLVMAGLGHHTILFASQVATTVQSFILSQRAS